MKALLISDKPKWCALMMNGDKTIEVRTSKALAKAIQKLIDENGYAEIYVYCSKDTDVLLHCYLDNKDIGYKTFHKNSKNQYWVNNACYDDTYKLNGKVLFKFRCYKVEEYVNGCKLDGDYSDYEYILKPSCLTEDELSSYCEDLSFYAIHISNLEIFDKPKELGEFNPYCENYYKNVDIVENAFGDFIPQYSSNEKCSHCKYYESGMAWCDKIDEPLTKAPQNMCYIEIEDSTHT